MYETCLHQEIGETPVFLGGVDMYKSVRQFLTNVYLRLPSLDPAVMEEDSRASRGLLPITSGTYCADGIE
jgi:hypothetical protein